MVEVAGTHQDETPEIWSQSLRDMISDNPQSLQDDFDTVNIYFREKGDRELTWSEYFYHRLVIHPSLRVTPLADIFARPNSQAAQIYEQDHTDDDSHGMSRTGKGSFYIKDFDSDGTLDNDLRKSSSYYRIYVTLKIPAGLKSEDIFGTTGLIQRFEKGNFCGTFKYPVEGRIAESRMESITLYTADEKNAKLAQTCIHEVFGERCNIWSTLMTKDTTKSFFEEQSRKFARHMILRQSSEVTNLLDGLLSKGAGSIL